MHARPGLGEVRPLALRAHPAPAGERRVRLLDRPLEEPGLLRHWDTDGARQKDWNFLTELETIWTFNNIGSRVAAAGQEVTVWDALTGALLSEWDQPSWVTALAFSPSSTNLATGHDDGAVLGTRILQTHEDQQPKPREARRTQ